MREVVKTSEAPEAVGPYSQAVTAGGFLFASGQIAIDPSTGQMGAVDMVAQTRQVMENLKAVLAAAGLTFADVVKTTVYLTDLQDFQRFNDAYATYFESEPPATTMSDSPRSIS